MIPEAYFAVWRHVRVHALLVGQRIDHRAMQSGKHLAEAPLAVAAGEKGVAVLFRYGVVVTFNLQVVEEAAFLVSLKSVVGKPFDNVEREEAHIIVGDQALSQASDEAWDKAWTEGEGGEHAGGRAEGIDASGAIRLKQVTKDRLLMIADVLAKSVILAYDEKRVGEVFDRIEPVAERLGRRPAVSVRQLLGHIGDVLITQHRMVGRVEVTEKPELVWDLPDLERFYVRLQEEYELRERDRALTRKLELISQTATTSLGVIQAQRGLRVEWYIVILIVMEIVLTLYSMFFAKAHI